MRILVTGSAGMLGSSLVPALRQVGYIVLDTDIVDEQLGHDLDVREEPLPFFMPGIELVIHLAAETDVDLCEQAPQHAYATNTHGTYNVARACAAHQIPMVYVSTAGVFAGDKRGRYVFDRYSVYPPYTPADIPSPVNVYGRTKLAGEYIVKDIAPAGSFTVRAGWQQSDNPEKDHKFIHHILTQVKAGAKVIHAVLDKIGTPTYTKDFSQALVQLIAEPQPCQLYHCVNSYAGSPPSRFDVAAHILEVLNLTNIKLVPVTSDFFKEQFPAPRADSEVLQTSVPMRDWKDALEDCLLTGWKEWLH